MLVVETIARIRREHFVRGKGIKAIARELRVSRKVIRNPPAKAALRGRCSSGGSPLRLV
jgi:hypothetical protein